ncbi:MAG: hypothetical protein M1836_002606 [Candelina mexicana]|nr:MAG: hypothetical protein M1836_002606 [Candelina mexicana]
MSVGFSTQTPQFHPQYPSSPIQVLDKLDEGYSEETRSQAGSDVDLTPELRPKGIREEGLNASLAALPEWIMAMGEVDRSELAHSILRTLRTSSVAAIVERLNPLLHLDPVLKLPPEMIYQVFSYLEPRDLLKASVASRSWRRTTLDSHLWKQLYGYEGWEVNTHAINSFEHESRKSDISPDPIGRSIRVRRAETDAGYQTNKRRMSESGLFGQSHGIAQGTMQDTLANDGPQAWSAQYDAVDADDSATNPSQQTSVGAEAGDPMNGVNHCRSSAITVEGELHTSYTPNVTPALLSEDSTSMSVDEMQLSPALGEQKFCALTPQPSPREIPIEGSLALPQPRGRSKINWQFLYKQRKRLEDNWSAGRFKNFQLPHPEHLYEAHRECVYTIQYSEKYLVSGSRDRTVRIWNLDTRRLVRRPLVGHKMSVLCLQFDERPEHDLIVSGSSDTDVIIWRFSTGDMIKRIEQAHGDPVLNLRFDDRFLVTCSKDKTIKVWNRRELLPGDKNLPTFNSKSTVKFPSYIIAMSNQASLSAASQPTTKLRPLPPYNLLMKLEGHQAAVNAIQLYKDQIVSASGDRNVKLWNIHTGDCEMTLPGHMKGIACVQFDGRRIVSGSSDNTVRIYDRATGAEVACLRGHSDLVRTVQAGFGDLPCTEADLKAEARAVDRDFFEARRRGLFSFDPRQDGHRQRNAGSRKPQDITAFGAHLPPGGGGSRWGRIVSGSYDQTVIIWKKDSEGRWAISQKLRQEEAVRAAGGPFVPTSAAAIAQAVLAHGPLTATIPQIAQVPGPSAANSTVSASTVVSNPTVTTIPNVPNPASQASTQTTQTNTAYATAQQLHAAALAHTAQAASEIQSLINTSSPALQPQPQPQPGPSNPSHALQALAAMSQVNHHPAPPQANAGGHPHGNIGGHGHGHGHGPAPGTAAAVAAAQANSRVFKLQFDSRRIICCSQDPRIVGWDFANGDEDIKEASKFFAGP